jgi:hypothetical protein
MTPSRIRLSTARASTNQPDRSHTQQQQSEPQSSERTPAARVPLGQLQRSLGNRGTARLLKPQSATPPAGSMPSVSRTEDSSLVQREDVDYDAIAKKSVPLQPNLQPAQLDSRMNAHLRDYKDIFMAQSGHHRLVLENHILGHTIKNKQGLMVDPNIKGGTTVGGTDWMYAEVRGYKGFIRAEKVRMGAPNPDLNLDLDQIAIDAQAAAANGPSFKDPNKPDNFKVEPFEGTQKLVDAPSSGLEMQYTKPLDDPFQMTGSTDKNKFQEDGSAFAAKEGLDSVAGAMDVVGGIFAIKRALNELKKQGIKPQEKAAQIFAMIESGSKIASGGAKFIDSFPKAVEGQKETGIESVSGPAEKVLGTVASFATVIKETFAIIKTGIDTKEKVDANGGLSGEAIFKTTMSILQSTLKAAAGGVKIAKNIMDMANSGVLTAGVMQAAPIIGLVLAAATLIVKGYNLIRAIIARSDMKDQMRELEGTEEVLDHSHDERRKYGVLRNKTQKIHEVNEDDLKQEIRDLRADPNFQTDPALQQRARVLEQYVLAGDLKIINEKRIRRATYQIAIEMGKIAGDVAMMSGVGAVAGGAIKGTAAATEVSFSVARQLKQYGRDHGWSGFDQSKNSRAKFEQRLNDARTILDMMVSLPDMPPVNPQNVALYRQAENVLFATGADMVELLAQVNKPEKMLETLVKAMALRE